MTFLSARLSRGKTGAAGSRSRLLVAIGIGVHNLGEGLAIGTSFSTGELQLGAFLVIGFMVHNVTEGLGIAAPASGAKVTLWQLDGARPDRGRARRSSAPGSAATRRTTSWPTVLRDRGRGRAPGRRRGRSLRRPHRAGRASLGLGDRRLPGRDRRDVGDRPPDRLIAISRRARHSRRRSPGFAKPSASSTSG